MGGVQVLLAVVESCKCCEGERKPGVEGSEIWEAKPGPDLYLRDLLLQPAVNPAHRNTA